MRRLQSLLQRTPWRHLYHPVATTDRPLLDSAAITTLRRRVAAQLEKAPASLHRVRQPQHGEIPAATLGRGMDYEDSRAYQPGDDPRSINWRLMARSAALSVKQFREERRQSVFLVVDRRATLRFGTRTRLKATQAAEAAAIAAFAALHNGTAVGGLIVNERPTHLAPAVGEDAALEFIRYAAAPCPPWPAHTEQATLAQVLQITLASALIGCQVVLISDLADLGAEHQGELAQVASRHALTVIQVLDSVELTLPAAGRLVLEDLRGGATATVDSADPRLQQDYAAAAQARLALQRQWVQSVGGRFVHLPTTVDALDTLAATTQHTV